VFPDNSIQIETSGKVPLGAWHHIGLTKAGAGTMRLTVANTYSGGTTVSAGKLMVNNATGSGTGAGGVTVNDCLFHFAQAYQTRARGCQQSK